MILWTTTRALARSLVIWPKNFPSASGPFAINGLCWIYAGLMNLCTSSDFFWSITDHRSQGHYSYCEQRGYLWCLQARSWVTPLLRQLELLFQADHLEAHRILFGI